MPLEDDLLTGPRLSATGETYTDPRRNGRSGGPAMKIAKVEPLTTGPARCAGRSTTAARTDGLRSGREPARGALRAAQDPRRRRRAGDLERGAPERLAEPIEALEAGASAELVRLGLWGAERYCSTPSRGLRPRPAARLRDRRRTRGARPRTERLARITDAGRAALETVEGSASGSGLCSGPRSSTSLPPAS